MWKWFWRSSVLVLLTVYFTRNIWLGPWVLGKIEGVLAEALGAEVELDGIGGNWWNAISLERARTLQPGDATSVQSFDLEQVQLRYSLWDLAQGRVEGLHALDVERVSLAVDSRQGAPTEEDEAPSEAFELPAGLPELRIGTLQVRYADASSEAQLEDATLSTLEAGKLQLVVPRLDFRRGEQVAPTTALQTVLQYADGVLEIPSLQVNAVERVQAARLDLAGIARGELGFDLALSVLEGSVEARGSLAEGKVQAELQAAGLVAEELEPWLDLGLRGQLDLQGSVDWPLAEPLQGVASFEFGAARNGWRQVELEAISGSVRLAQGWLVSERLSAQGPDLDLLAVDCRVPLFAEDPEAAPTGGRIELDVRDLPGWLRRLELELPAETAALQSASMKARLSSTAQRVAIELETFRLHTQLGSWVEAQVGAYAQSCRRLACATGPTAAWAVCVGPVG